MRILIIDDDPDYVDSLKKTLGAEHSHDFFIALDGPEGVRMAETKRPDLIILDLELEPRQRPKVGYDYCTKIREELDAKEGWVPILMLTGHLDDGERNRVKGLAMKADDFMHKTSDSREVCAAVTSLLRRVAPYRPCPPTGCVLTLILDDKQRIDIQVSGELNVGDHSDNPLSLEVAAAALQANLAFQSTSGHAFKQLGLDLYDKVFADHSRILRTYDRALGKMSANLERLHLRLQAQRDYLRVPLEFLFDANARNGAEYLIFSHPVTWRISGIQATRPPINCALLNDLHHRESELSILLIASNTPPGIPSVDEEVYDLESRLKGAFYKRGIKTRIDVIKSADATYSRVREELKNCHYHVVHYAGHGVYNNSEAQHSHIILREGTGLQHVHEVPVAELHGWLKESNVRLFYLSCCFGATTGAREQLLAYDFLGIADGLIRAAVPSVLGFRKPVGDAIAAQLAIAFYEELAECGQIDTALYKVRQEFRGRLSECLSLVLIEQS